MQRKVIRVPANEHWGCQRYADKDAVMTEFSKGMMNAVTDRMDESLALAIIFFIGHIIIAMTVVSLITGASIWEAGAVALIEPAVNSVWFYVLHKFWRFLNEK